MNLGNNKTLVVFGSLLLVGCAAFCYLFIAAYGAYSAADEKTARQLTELKRLESLPLYPEAANLKLVEAQKATARKMADDLFEKVRPIAFPLEPITPDQFQQRLTAAVARLAEKAEAQGVRLGEGGGVKGAKPVNPFYLGFGEYKVTAPSPAAAPALGRQLRSIEFVVETLIDKKVDAILEVTRPPLPEEPDRHGNAAPTPAPAAGEDGPAAAPAGPLVAKYPFRVQFVSEQKVFQGALNDLSKNDRQFFIIVPETLRNQSEKSPKRSDASAKLTSQIAQGQTLRYVLGAEKLDVTLRFDAVVFADRLPE